MVPSSFESLLKASIGLDASSIGASAIERAVRERQAACDIEDPQAYWQRVRASRAEMQALIEAVVVSETWFFRDHDQFAALVEVVRNSILPRRANGVIRLLSLPCSTGEEPYSIAMALADTGVPLESFRIDAIDISEEALASARQGLYGKSSFRGVANGSRARHFERRAAGFQISDEIRGQVTFQHGNLFTAEGLVPAAAYDVIFCRNLLIYFDRATQQRAVASLTQLLTSDGFLFVGAAEAGAVLNHGLASSRVAGTQVFQKSQPSAKRATRTATPPSRSLRPATSRRPVIVATPRPAVVVAEAKQPAAVERSSQASLDAGMDFANQGRFLEAVRCCEEYLREHGPSAQAFHLLGLVRDARGESAEAIAYYRKALYLDPQHQETLEHLALLMDAQDNRAEAQLLRIRARRIAQRGSTT